MSNYECRNHNLLFLFHTDFDLVETSVCNTIFNLHVIRHIHGRQLLHTLLVTELSIRPLLQLLKITQSIISCSSKILNTLINKCTTKIFEFKWLNRWVLLIVTLYNIQRIICNAFELRFWNLIDLQSDIGSRVERKYAENRTRVFAWE